MAPTVLAATEDSQVLQGDPIGTNLLGGVSPFLALLGENFTNRYLSQSVDLCDCIAFAMIPTGVPYAAKVLYRLHQTLGARKYAKGPLDPALDPNDSALEMFYSIMERDLLASTSKYVCQIWNGREVEKVITSTELVREYIFNDSGLIRSQYAKHPGEGTTASLSKEKKSIISERPSLHSLYRTESWEETAENELPPNLQLNLAPYWRVFQGRTLAAIGLFLQLSIIALAALSAFYWPVFSSLFYGKCRAIRIVAFVFVASGTILLTTGLAYIAWAINTTVRPAIWKPIRQTSNKSVLVVWIQRYHAHLNTEGYVLGKWIDKELLSVHRAPNAYPSPDYAYFFLFITAFGFLLQSVGLSMMHWPVQTLQFLSMIIMFLGRWYVRRQEAPDFVVRVKLERFENAAQLQNAKNVAANAARDRR